jgi:hypothetical protein
VLAVKVAIELSERISILGAMAALAHPSGKPETETGWDEDGRSTRTATENAALGGQRSRQ